MKIPKYRFPEFKDEWNEVDIADILKQRKTIQRISDDAPLLSFTIEEGVINPKDKKTNKRDFLMKDKDNKKFLLTELNDIIYNPANIKFGAIHRNKFQRGVVSPIYVTLTTKEVPAFVENLVRRTSFINSSKKYLEGTVEKLKTLKADDFLKLKVVIPPTREEQEKIANCLSSVDAVIADYEAQVENMQTQKKGVMQKLFSQEVRFKADDGSEYPEWIKMKIGDILTICHGKDYKHLGKGDIPVMGTGGVITYVDESLCDWECVCIGRKGTIDKPYYMNSPFWSVDTLFYTKPHDNQSVKFQYYLFETINWKKHNEASGVPSLSASTVESIKVDVPCLEEQQKIADCLTAFDDAIEDLQKTVEHWKNIKKGLLQQLFA